MNTQILLEIFEICLIPLLGYLTTRFIAFLDAKKQEVKAKTDNELAHKYLDMIVDTVTRCVMATNQTYVDTLKKEGSFDKEAQEIAFQKTFNAVMAILSEDMKQYIIETFGDL